MKSGVCPLFYISEKKETNASGAKREQMLFCLSENGVESRMTEDTVILE